MKVIQGFRIRQNKTIDYIGGEKQNEIT